MTEPAEITFSDDICSNVELLEQRAADAAQQEMDRSQTLDQKSAGLIAAAVVLVAAGVAGASETQTPRNGAVAAPLPDGQVLIAGGENSTTAKSEPIPFPSAELFRAREPSQVRRRLLGVGERSTNGGHPCLALRSTASS
jgi:hypothetical protein